MPEQKVDESKLKKATKQDEKASQFSEEELKAVQEIQKTYLNIQADLGQVSVAKLRLQQQMDALDEARQLLDEKFKETNTRENSLIESITEKYGIGTLDPKTGVFSVNN